MFDQENCIFYINEEICEKNIDKIKEKDFENLPHFCCTCCNDKKILEENEEIKIETREQYTLKRENGKLIKK